MALRTEAPKTEAPGLRLAVIECLAVDQLIDIGNNEFVATVGARPDLTRQDGTPSQSGDVLSVQIDGTLQTRPAGTTGSYERCCKTAAGAVYRPIGKEGPTIIVPLAPDAPNK